MEFHPLVNPRVLLFAQGYGWTKVRECLKVVRFTLLLISATKFMRLDEGSVPARREIRYSIFDLHDSAIKKRLFVLVNYSVHILF